MRTRRIGPRQPVAAALTSILVLLGGGCAASEVAVSAALPASAGAAVPTPAARPVTVAELRGGLLGLKEVAAGFMPVTGAGDEDGPRAVFGGAGCEELAQLLNARKLPGSRAEAAVALSSGLQGGAAVEQLHAMDSPKAAARVVDRYRRGASRCREITLSAAGAGSSTFFVRPISSVEVGDASFATRGSAASSDGPVDQDFIQVTAHSGAVVVVMTFMGASPSDAETVTEAAVNRVHHKLAARESRLLSDRGTGRSPIAKPWT
jgi:hypothetical protein